MDLRATVLSLARKMDTPLSAESLASLALYRISQLPCFGDIYRYMNLVKEGSEYALRSPFLKAAMVQFDRGVVERFGQARHTQLHYPGLQRLYHFIQEQIRRDGEGDNLDKVPLWLQWFDRKAAIVGMG